MTAKKFRKRPVIIEAEQWFPGDHVAGVIAPHPTSTTQLTPYVATIEGPLNVSPGDWIITGVQGERYPIKDSIFRETYELADVPTSVSDGS